jgi:hypothetical protein
MQIFVKTLTGMTVNTVNTYQVMQLTEKEPEKPEEEGDEIGIPDDIYGATMYSIIFDFYEMFGATGNSDELHISMNIMRVLFVTCVLATNYLLQGGMLYWIYTYVVLPSVHGVQKIYQEYHADVFDESGKYNKEKWGGWEPEKQDELCSIAFSSYWFMFAILALWTYTMLIEVRKTERLMRDIKSVEDCTDLHDMIDQSSGSDRIVKLTKGIDWILFLVIIMPKMIIGLGLLLIGCVWLMATDSFADLILNAVALEFVVNIDNLLFEAAMPASIVLKMEETKFWVKKSKMSTQEHHNKVAAGYYRSMFYFFGVWALVFLMMKYGQNIPYAGVFPGYAGDAFCPTWQAENSARICMAGENCFPFGK